jgi:hypothetical protein
MTKYDDSPTFKYTKDNKMATKKTTMEAVNTLDFDIKEFRRQKELMEKHAAKGIADRIDAIKVMLTEIKDLAELSGNRTLRLGGSFGQLSSLIEAVDNNHEDWNSSSYDC